MQPVLRDLRQVPLQIDVFKTIKNDSVNLLDAFVDLVFEFVDQPLLPSQVRTTSQFRLLDDVLQFHIVNL